MGLETSDVDAEDLAAVALERIRTAGLKAGVSLVRPPGFTGAHQLQLRLSKKGTPYPIGLARSLDEVAAMLPEPYASAVAMQAPLPATVFPPLPDGLVWNITALHIGVQVRADGARLSVTLGWELLDQEYVAVAIETVDGAADVEMLDAHAHQLLGRFKTEGDAKEAAEKYAAQWRGGATAGVCECGPIK